VSVVNLGPSSATMTVSGKYLGMGSIPSKLKEFSLLNTVKQLNSHKGKKHTKRTTISEYNIMDEGSKSEFDSNLPQSKHIMVLDATSLLSFSTLSAFSSVYKQRVRAACKTTNVVIKNPEMNDFTSVPQPLIQGLADLIEWDPLDFRQMSKDFQVRKKNFFWLKIFFFLGS
jgi:hypothetical protein